MNKVCVIMSIYKNDQLSFVEKAVSSILLQTFQQFDYIIALDGPISNDIENYIDQLSDPRVKVLKRTKNKGLAFTLNEMVEYGLNKGYEYYFRMDADDVSFPSRLERTMKEFEKIPKLLLVGAECNEVNELDEFLFYKKMPGTKEAIINKMYTRCPFIHPTVAFRKEFFDKVGLYDTNYTLIEDLDLWARAIVANIEMKNINEVLLDFRISNNYWQRRSSWSKIFKELKISWYLVRKLKVYHKIHKVIIIKFLARLTLKIMPARINQILYKKLRK